jgi:branched-chain amino acid transport system permease protein
MNKNVKLILNILLAIALIIISNFTPEFLPSYVVRLISLSLIYAIAAMSLNLINGFTGLFSLGHAGFMAIGAYTTALLTLSAQQKEAIWTIVPIVAPLKNISIPYPIALLIGGLVGAIAGFLIGLPVLRLKGDYLAVASLGFGEIISIVFFNLKSLTNGALGISGIKPLRGFSASPRPNNFWPMIFCILTFVLLAKFLNSSYGRAVKAIREDEIAAESMGIGLGRHKTMSFTIGAFFAAIAGGLLAAVIGSITPAQFTFVFTYTILLIVVIGGMGSLTGSILASFIVTFGMEQLRFMDRLAINIGPLHIPAREGMRMVVFSILLILMVLFFRKGIMGTNEITWDNIVAVFTKKKKNPEEA